MENFLPCPFCGTNGDPVRKNVRQYDDNYEEVDYYLECEECKLIMGRDKGDNCYGNYYCTWIKPEDALNYWNNRWLNKKIKDFPIQCMALDTPIGAYVELYTLTAGYVSDQEFVKKYLVLGNKYKVKKLNVDSWSSSVEFEEFPNKLFNTVFFRNTT